MAIIQLTPQNFILTINGTDYTANLAEGLGNWSSFDDSGLFIITGRFTLLDVPGTAVTLDDRYNSDFCRGNEIIFTVNGDRAPVIGTTYIESAQYDEFSGRQEVQMTCWLGLLNAITPRDLGVCVTLGSSSTIDSVVDNLLTTAGVPVPNVDITGITGSLNKSVFTQEGGSIISTAGQIAFANAHCLYQDNQGVVRNISINPLFGANIVSLDLVQTVQWERVRDSVLPPDTVTVDYAITDICDLDTTQRSTSLEQESYTEVVSPLSQVGGVARTQTVTGQKQTVNTVQYSGRTITKDTTVTRPTQAVLAEVSGLPDEVKPNALGNLIAEKQTVIETYESPSGTANGSGVSGCFPVDEGRLIRRETGTYMPVFVAMAEAAQQAITDFDGKTPQQLRDEGENNAARDLESRLNSLLSTSLILVETQTETWAYNIPIETIDESNVNLAISEALGGVNPLAGGGSTGGYKNASVVYQSQTLTRTGNLFPFIGSPTLGTASAVGVQGSLSIPHTYFDAFSFSLRATQTTKWALNDGDKQTWTAVDSQQQNGFEASPDQFLALQQLATDDVGATTNANLFNMFTGASKMVTTVSRGDSDSPPPDPGRFPSDSKTNTEPKKVNINVTSDLGCNIGRPRQVNLGEFTSSRDSAVAVGAAVALADWSRSKSQLMSFDLAQIPIDIRPLHTISIQKPSEAVEIYGCDSPSVIFKLDEAIFSTIGLFVGLVPGSGEDKPDPAGANGGTPGWGGSPPVREDNPTNTTIFPPSSNPDPLNPVVLPPVQTADEPSVFFPDTSVDPPTTPTYPVSNPVATATTPNLCIDVTVVVSQVLREGDLSKDIGAFDGCFTNNTVIGVNGILDAHPVIIDRFVLSNGDGLILQSVTPTADSFRGNPSQIASACIFPDCTDSQANPPQEAP